MSENKKAFIALIVIVVSVFCLLKTARDDDRCVFACDPPTGVDRSYR